MATGFEDEFMDKQSEIIGMCLDAVDGEVDKVYAYGSVEKTSRMFNVFYEHEGTAKMLNELDVSLDENRQILRWGREILEEMKELCERHGQRMPTELKMVYDNKTGGYYADFQYEPIDTEESEIDAHDVFTDWMEEIEAQLSN